MKTNCKTYQCQHKNSYNVIVAILWSQRFSVPELPGQYQICLDFEKHPIFLPENRHYYLADIYGVCNCISCEYNDLIIVPLETLSYQP